MVAGCVAGSAARVAAVKHRLDHLGGTLDPHAGFLLERGMKTMGLRVRRQNETALVLARMLEAHPRVARVHYPGLESHPDHAVARALFVEGSGGGYGGMLSLELDDDVAGTERFLGALTIPLRASSFGGVESLVSRPATTSHAGLTPAERAGMGIPETMVRVSVGIEDAGDLVADFERALASEPAA